MNGFPAGSLCRHLAFTCHAQRLSIGRRSQGVRTLLGITYTQRCSASCTECKQDFRCGKCRQCLGNVFCAFLLIQNKLKMEVAKDEGWRRSGECSQPSHNYELENSAGWRYCIIIQKKDVAFSPPIYFLRQHLETHRVIESFGGSEPCQPELLHMNF